MSGIAVVDSTGLGPRAIIYQRWIRATAIHELPDHAFRLWVVLWTYADADGSRVWPSVDTLSEVSGRSRRATFRALKELVDAGVVEKRIGTQAWQPNGRSSTRYHLHDPTLRRCPECAYRHTEGLGCAAREKRSA